MECSYAPPDQINKQNVKPTTETHQSLLVNLFHPLTYIYHMFVKFIMVHKFYCIFGGESRRKCWKWNQITRVKQKKFNNHWVDSAISGRAKSNESMNVSTLSYVHVVTRVMFKQMWKVHLINLRANASFIQWTSSPSGHSVQH